MKYYNLQLKKEWIKKDNSHTWFINVFLFYISKARTVLLVFGGSVGLIQMTQENNLHILKIPSHTSHYLQSLDVCTSELLKTT